MRYFSHPATACVALLLNLAFSTFVLAEDIYQQPADFLASAFDGELPPASRLWITEEIRPAIRNILGRDLGQLRVRYWRGVERTAWILDEIGKDRPITTGIVVEGGKVTTMRVLIYRESRGAEVRHPAFVDQFYGARLRERDELDRPIAGITGATLSVRALTRLARLALLLDQHARAE